MDDSAPGATIDLRPVQDDDFPTLEVLIADPGTAGEFGWFGWFDRRRLRRTWEENGLLGASGGTLMVMHGDERLGLVNWRRRETNRSSYCWNMGIALLPNARGRGFGTQAHRLLARYLFAHDPAPRIEAETEVGNLAEQRALEKAGFSREGVIRSSIWRDGSWRDGVIYSLLRTDPSA